MVAVMTEQPPSASIQVHVPEELVDGVYANLLSVWHTAYEFTLDFASLQQMVSVVGPDGAETNLIPTRVVARVKIPPTQIFEILRALNENMSHYESTYGPITPVGETPTLYPPTEFDGEEPEAE
jgi:hypothetical protein